MTAVSLVAFRIFYAYGSFAAGIRKLTGGASSGTHTMRQNNPVLVYRFAYNLQAVLLQGRSELESAVRYLRT